MVSFNLKEVNGAITFIVGGSLNLKAMAEAVEESLNAERASDVLLRDTGIIDDHDFYTNELRYCRTERIILMFKQAPNASISRSSFPTP